MRLFVAGYIPTTDCCGRGNEPLVFIQRQKFILLLSNFKVELSSTEKVSLHTESTK